VHLGDTSEIVAFLVAGVNTQGGRARVSFVTGWEAVSAALDDSLHATRIASRLNASKGDLLQAIAALDESSSNLLATLRTAVVEPPPRETVGDLELVIRRLDGAPARVLGDIGARLAKAAGTGRRVCILWSSVPAPAIALSAAGVPGVQCGVVVSESCAALGGRGGGGATLATGAARDIAALVSDVEGRVRAVLSKNPG
jgi:alanyl-tRNA synthetase